MKIAFDEKTNTYKAEDAEPKPEVAEMEMNLKGTIGKVADIKVFGVPVGGPILGGATAIVVDRVLLDKIDPTHKYAPWSLLGAALVIGKFGQKLSPEWAKWTAGILVYEAAADTISMLIDKYWPKPTTTTTTTAQAMRQSAGLQQFPATSGDYYSKAFTRN